MASNEKNLPEQTPLLMNYELNSSLFSRATYSWLNRLLNEGLQKSLKISDLNELENENKAKEINEKFENAWREETKNSKERLQIQMARAGLRAFGRDFILSGCCLFLYNINGVSTPLLIRSILIWLEEPNSNTIWYPITLIIILFLMQIASAFTYNYQFELAAKSASREKYSIGMMVNLSSTDCLKIDLACQYFHMIWCSAILIIECFIILYFYLGISALAGFLVIILYIPVQFYLSKINATFRSKALIFTDRRMKIIQESLKGIRVIKSYNWEASFLKIISALRSSESKLIYFFLATRATTSSITQGIPTVAMVVTFIIYSYLSNPLSMSLLIPSLALFFCLRVPMLFMPVGIAYSIDAWISSKRIAQFLLSSELEAISKPDVVLTDAAIEIIDGEFEWDCESGIDPKKMDKINVCIPNGKLVAIVGQVGSGKSSLLQIFLGDLKKKRGYLSISGKIGYCQQQPWIINASIQENILFGSKYDAQKWKEVISACSLEKDISKIDGGASAEIGENGINISGGQKARLALARACYNDADIYLLDDPLSAVDAHVGKHLFNECICGYLSNKTRLLVTHQLHVLEKVDLIILMDDCKIVDQGTYEDLYRSSKAFTTLMDNYNRASDTDAKVVVEKKYSPAEKMKVFEENEGPTEVENSKTRLIVAEEQAQGATSFAVIKEYFFSLGGPSMLFSLFFFISASNVTRVFTDQWLLYWSAVKYPLTWELYAGFYVALSIFQIFFAVFYGMLLAHYGAKASRQLHDSALSKVYSSPLSFFDSTPLGRITSRFSRDTDTLDSLLPESIRGFTWTLVMCLANLIVIAVFVPIFLVAICIASLIYYQVQKKYRATARELRRIDSVSRSPILAMLTESLTGTSTIRAFGVVDKFISRNLDLLNSNNKAQYLVLMTQRWIQLRLDILNSIMVLLTGIAAIVFNNELEPGLTGLLIVYALQITQTFAWTIKTGADVETFFNCAERLIYYMYELPTENPYELDFKPPKEWPACGHMIVSSICLRYRSDLPRVLNGVSFEVKSAEKIGIVGRTGAGKSTILSAFLRLVELESGSINIDGIDISKIGLSALRSRLAIIPQEPVLFSGTVRFNLDPFGENPDEELWVVLKRASLSAKVSNDPQGLDAFISEGGDNWSVGERQLICLARAMLRRSKVILLDEATASVDFETDEAIQKAIRSDFCDCTVITIAHRVNTIADYDKILVLGETIEFDTPSALLSINSEFAKLVSETGSQNEAIIRMIACSKVSSS